MDKKENSEGIPKFFGILPNSISIDCLMVGGAKYCDVTLKRVHREKN